MRATGEQNDYLIFKEEEPQGFHILANSNAILYVGDPWWPENGGVLIRNLCFYNMSLNANQVMTIYNNQANTPAPTTQSITSTLTPLIQLLLKNNINNTYNNSNYPITKNGNLTNCIIYC
jgi:hypothetical protein